MKTRSIQLLITFLFFSLTSLAQDLEWARSMGGNYDDYGTKSIKDDSGNVYLTGYFNSVADMDPSSNTLNFTSSGGRDFFVTKLDSSGNLLWSQQYGSIGNDNGIAITIDSWGYIYVTGYFSNTVDFDAGTSSYNLTSAGGNEIYVLKLDGAGNLQWAKRMGGSSLDWGFSIDVDNLGNVYTTGWFEGTSDFDPSSSTYYLSSSGQNVFVSKLDSNGNFIWAKNIGSSGLDNACYVYVDKLYNVFIGGLYSGSVDFDPGVGNSNLSSSGATDAFLLKLDSSGKFSWVKSFGGSGNDRIHTVTMDTSYNIYLTGFFHGNVDFDPGLATYNLSSSGGQDVFVSKFDSSGSFIWAKKFGGSGDDLGRHLTTDISGNVYTVGKFEGQVDFDPGSGTHFLSSKTGSFDVFIAKLNSKGDFIWAWKFGDYLDDYCTDIKVDSAFNIYITGGFGGTVDFDPDLNSVTNLSSNGGLDIFICKFSQCANSSSVIAVAACESYTSPSGKYKWTSSGTYRDTISNSEGCDSTMTIGLQINKNSNAVQFKSACDSLRSPSGKYTWYKSGTYTDTLQNYLGCDSSLIIGLIIYNTSSNSMIETACDSYLSPSGKYIWTQSGNYSDTLSNAGGCDSILNITLKILNDTSISLTEKACNSYLSPSGKYTWTTSGTYYDTLNNINGCDTTFIISLSVNTVDTAVIATGSMSLKANALGAIYQWVDCNNAYAPISGKTHQSFTASKSGSYAVIVSQNNCTDTSSCYQLINTSTLENQSENGFFLYPNPAKDKLTIESPFNGVLKLFNSSGKLVYESLNESGTQQHDISMLSKGLYLLQFTNNKAIINKKLVIFN